MTEHLYNRLIQDTTKGMISYRKDIADAMDIDFLGVMKSDRMQAYKFMQMLDIRTIEEFFFFVQENNIDIKRFFFFNNRYTKIPRGMIYNMIYDRWYTDAEIQDYETKPYIELFPEDDDEDINYRKSDKFLNQPINKFFDDIQSLIKMHDVDINNILELIQGLKRGVDFDKQNCEIFKDIYTALLPVYLQARKWWYNHNDLCM